MESIAYLAWVTLNHKPTWTVKFEVAFFLLGVDCLKNVLLLDKYFHALGLGLQGFRVTALPFVYAAFRKPGYDHEHFTV